MNLANTYKGKKVFLTGHTGFKGSWLLSWLHLFGAEVRGLALAPLPEHKLYELLDGNKLCDSVFKDIQDFRDVRKSILEFRPDFIFHLAAQPIVRTSYEIPLETFSVNAMGTANLLQAARALDSPCSIIVITTDKVYQNLESGVSFRESDPVGGFDPYSASKACAELIVGSYRNCFFDVKEYSVHKKGVAVARAGNVIGGGDYAKDRIIPDSIRSLKKKEPILVRNPGSVRPWQHVLEPLYGYLLLGQKLASDPVHYSTAYNFGPREADCWTVEKMVSSAIEAWGSGSYEVIGNEKQPYETGLLKLDIHKAKKELDWHPRYSAKEAIQQTIDWYKQIDNENAYTLTKGQILSFEDHLVKVNH
jgi:CDP-glucose 4,6-dehydratase